MQQDAYLENEENIIAWGCHYRDLELAKIEKANRDKQTLKTLDCGRVREKARSHNRY